LPNYTNREIDDTIALLKNGGCTHISSYLLKIEPKTQFFINRPAGLPTDDQSADFYLYAVNTLAEKGYLQYEISNFAQKGFESRHNLIYWDCENYLGLGAAAHSCINGKRFYYPPSMADFVNNSTRVFDGICDVNDYIMLQLRLNSGLDLQKLKEKFKFVFDDNKMQFLQKCCKNGMAILKNNVLCLTPKGMLLQNSILAEIL
ncbi:MAG: coproporphyrinogen III oxidase family protein, partial [Oscillospiraceae bacterium]